MTLHKLTAGDGYTYLTGQVAALDSTEKGFTGLGDYYTQRGESPGRWGGAGMAGLGGLDAGEAVSETQMKALFGEGRHPDADAIERAACAAGTSAGDARGWTQLGHPFKVFQAVNEFRAACATRFADYNAAIGFPRDWPVPAGVRAQIRTDIGREGFQAAFGRPPAEDRELAGYIARASRQATTAVAGYDLTFTPVKSVSTLWAVAPREVAEQIEAGHDAAVADTVGWLERRASYTRTGRNGVRQVDVTGLIAAVFTHRDSRDGDPNRHTHVAISNKVQTRDGRWLALDGRVVFKATVAASERYNTRLEAQLVARLGVSFAERAQPDAGKRPIREIVGVDPRLNEAWSSRRAAIDARRGELAAAFQRDQGRPPTAIEAIALAQQANLETRAAKHEPRSHAEQRAAWRTEAVRVLGSARALRQMTDAALQSPAATRAADEEWVHAAAGRVLDTVAAGRATWQVWHVRAEAERVARGADLSPDRVDDAVEAVVTEALSAARSVRLGDLDRVSDPQVLRRRDGASVYTVAGTQLHSSPAVLAAEKALLAAARRTDGRRVDEQTVDLALLESAANRVELNPGQAQLVRELATSGARLQLAIAAAGSGKTTAMRVLGRAWVDGGGQVLGLAPTAVAAAALREQLGAHTDTLAKLTWSLTAPASVPAWVTGIGAGTLVVIDEAGMAGTADLAAAVQFILGRGGSVRLVGDDQQLAAIAAGGVLRDIATSIGAVTLSQLVRFADPAEGAASIAVRGGDPAGLGFYLDRGRVHVGDPGTVAEHAYTGWAADRRGGRDAVMLAPTREQVATLNARARADRLAAAGAPAGADVVLVDGNRASVGDVVTTRRNNRQLPTSATDWVKNGDRWEVTAVHAGGDLDVAHLRTARRITLPADYVTAHVELGYAATVHGAQGITADTCHTVLAGTESRQLLYVAVTRGRHANHLYLATAADGDPHSVITPAAIHPPTATDVLTAILARDQAQRSAVGLAADLADPARRLGEAAARYTDSLGVAAETVLGAQRMTEVHDAAEQAHPGLTDSPAWPTLRAQLAVIGVDGGRDPATELTAAMDARQLRTADDPAAVLDWRLDPTGAPASRRGPLPWLPAVPDQLAGHPQWGPYLTARSQQVGELAAAVTAHAAGWTPTTAPAWATRLLDDPDAARLRGELAVWRAATATPEQDRRPAGPPPPAAAEARHHRTLTDRAHAVLGRADQAAARWALLADSLDPRIAADPYWPELAGRIAAADRAGIDIAGILTAAAQQRPLPDEQPAAALWWRLSGHLAPAALGATAGSGAATLRPAWTAALLDSLTPQRAERVLADPAWPALVAAVNHGLRAGWTPEGLLPAAARLDADAAAYGGDVPADELANALVWRVAMLCDPEPLDVEAAAPPDPEAEPFLAPPDLHLLNTTPPSTAAATPNSDLAVEVEPPFDPYLDPAPADPADYLLEEHRWATAVVPRARLVDLNTEAAGYFAARYPDSWAAGYLTERLGCDLAADPRFAPGYAPAGWTGLVEHLRALGGTDTEILAAGLGTRARTGNIIDRFRDRLVFPIHGPDGDVHGFIGRRNPATDNADRAGPKYLNTPETDLYRKGAQLLGLHEGTAALADGATPVLVEGPVDAWSVTLAGDGRYVGVAPLGTAFTDRQADQLRPHISDARPGIIVATDADPAGHRAAERAYWQLTARGDNPTRLAMPDGQDPADILRTGGAEALQQKLQQAGSLAEHLIDQRITTATATATATAEQQVAAIRAAAEVIGALRPHHWLHHIDRLTDTLDAAPGSVHLEVIEAGTAWILDPAGQAATHLTRRTPWSPTAPPTPDVERWRDLAHNIDPRLPNDSGWPALAAALTRAADSGYDIPAQLPRLAAQGPLTGPSPATELRYRLHAATPAAPHPDPAGQSQAATSRPTRTPQPPTPTPSRQTADRTPNR